MLAYSMLTDYLKSLFREVDSFVNKTEKLMRVVSYGRPKMCIGFSLFQNPDVVDNDLFYTGVPRLIRFV